MGRDTRSKGRGFESWAPYTDVHFSTCICCKNCSDVCLKRSKIKEKEVGVGPFLKKLEAIFNSRHGNKLRRVLQITHVLVFL